MAKKHTEKEYLELEQKYGALTINYKILGNQKMDLEEKVEKLKAEVQERLEVNKELIRMGENTVAELKAVKEKSRNDFFDKIEKLCDLTTDLNELTNFRQIRAKLADTETNLAIAQDDRKFLKKENARLSVENTELKKQLADLQKNTAEAIGGMYNGHFSAQEQFVIYVKREMNKIFEPFISKDDNDTED